MTETTDAAAIFAPLWRRKWLILAVAIVVAGASYLYYKRQPSLYSSTSRTQDGGGSCGAEGQGKSEIGRKEPVPDSHRGSP
jgi:Chain length determinant protein